MWANLGIFVACPIRVRLDSKTIDYWHRVMKCKRVNRMRRTAKRAK